MKSFSKTLLLSLLAILCLAACDQMRTEMIHLEKDESIAELPLILRHGDLARSYLWLALTVTEQQQSNLKDVSEGKALEILSAKKSGFESLRNEFSRMREAGSKDSFVFPLTLIYDNKYETAAKDGRAIFKIEVRNRMNVGLGQISVACELVNRVGQENCVVVDADFIF